MAKSIVDQLTEEMPEKVVHVQVTIPVSLHREVCQGFEKLRERGVKTSWQKMLLASAQRFRDELAGEA